LQEVDDVGVAEPDQSALGAVEFQEEVHEGCQPGVDLAGAVVEEVGEPVGQGAAFAEPAAEQHPLEAAAVAGEIAADPRAVAADRDAVRIAAGQQSVGAAARTVASDAHGPLVAGAADRPVGPLGRLRRPPAAA
jgi:hypothetical protein